MGSEVVRKFFSFLRGPDFAFQVSLHFEKYGYLRVLFSIIYIWTCSSNVIKINRIRVLSLRNQD